MKLLVCTLAATNFAGMVIAFVNYAKYREEKDKVHTAEAYNRVLTMRIDSLREELNKSGKTTAPTAEVVTKLPGRLKAKKMIQ
jgi:hypothetical protein